MPVIDHSSSADTKKEIVGVLALAALVFGAGFLWAEGQKAAQHVP